jgi:hypothetical protein
MGRNNCSTSKFQIVAQKSFNRFRFHSVRCNINTCYFLLIILSSSSSIGTTTLSWVSACSTVVEHSQQEGFYRVPLPAASLFPNLEENQGFRAFQLSPQEAPSVWSDASEPSSGRWNYGREMVEKFCRKWRLPRHFWVLLHAVKHDMGQTALFPLPRKACWGFFRTKNSTASAGFKPANSGTKSQHATSRPPKPLLLIITNFYNADTFYLKELEPSLET